MPNWKKVIISGSNAELNNLNVTSAVTASSYTGSFVGDGSGILNVVSSSYALTASYVENAQTASFVTTAQTASYIAGANVDGTVANATSASYAQTASYAVNFNISQSLTASGLIYPTSDGDDGRVIVTDGAGNLSLGDGERLVTQVRNDEGSNLDVGDPIYSRGEIGSSNRILVGKADSSDSAKMPAIGILQQDLDTSGNKDGFAVVTGILNEDVSGFTGLTEGDILYVAGGGGGLTITKPTGSGLIQNVGVILKTNGTTIQGFNISDIGRSNDVPNLPTGKIWVGSDYTVTSSIVTLDEPNSQAQITGSLIVTNAVTASSYTGSFVGDGSGILNVVSSSYAVTASHALNAGGADTVVVQYGHTSGNALGDSADYFIGMGTTMGNTGNSSIQIGIQAGTLVRADIATYNASTFGSSEASTVSVFSNNFAQENTISTSVLFNARHSLVSVTGLSINLLAGLSAIKLLTPIFTTNPASAKINITLYIEI